jgi:UDP-3-O-[3-hydroxymyristoyl] glucosamine N-acyltransferase
LTSPAPSAQPGGGGTRSLTAAAIAGIVAGELRGDGSVVIRGAAALDRATPEQVSFLAGQKYAPLLASSSAGAVLVSPDLADAPGPVATRIVVARPYEAMLRILPQLYPEPPAPTGLHPTAVIGRGVIVGESVSVGAYAVVGDGAVIADGVQVGSHCTVGAGVTVGEASVLFPSVTLYPGSRIGRRVRLHSGVRIGSDGFGYVFHEGGHRKIPHVGRCIIEDDVEIGANTTVDRGSIDDTVIGAGTKIDNLVMIAHNVRIGRLCLILAQAGIAGSARVEDGCIIAGQAGIAGHHTVGARGTVAAQAGLFGDLPPGETWSGHPARPHREQLRAYAALYKLPRLIKVLERLAAEEGE